MLRLHQRYMQQRCKGHDDGAPLDRKSGPEVMSRPMQIAVLFWGATVVSAVALVLLVVNMMVASGNRARQAELGQRAQIIADVAQRSRNVPLIRDLVIAAQKEPNTKIRALLTKYGIVFAPILPTPQSEQRREAPLDDDDPPAALSTASPEKKP
jgi:hypothetical protein